MNITELVDAIRKMIERERAGCVTCDALTDYLHDDWFEQLRSFKGRSNELDYVIDELFCINAVPLEVQLDLLLKYDPEPDGPVPGGWRYKGKIYEGLTTKPYRLVSYLWQHGRSCDWSDLAETWGDHAENMEEGDAIPSARKRANKFFKAHGIPLSVSTPKYIAKLVDHDWPEKS